MSWLLIWLNPNPKAQYPIKHKESAQPVCSEHSHMPAMQNIYRLYHLAGHLAFSSKVGCLSVSDAFRKLVRCSRTRRCSPASIGPWAPKLEDAFKSISASTFSPSPFWVFLSAHGIRSCLQSSIRLSFVENDCVTIDDYVVFGSEVMLYTDTSAPWVPQEYNKKLEKKRGLSQCSCAQFHKHGHHLDTTGSKQRYADIRICQAS